MSKQKRSIENITGLWKRTSTNRVGKDGKPEVYYVGTPVRIAKEDEEQKPDVVIGKGDVLHLYPSTNPGKSGSPTWFLKIKRHNGTTEEVPIEIPIGE